MAIDDQEGLPDEELMQVHRQHHPGPDINRRSGVSAEHLAKMAEGRRKAAERRAAEQQRRYARGATQNTAAVDVNSPAFQKAVAAAVALALKPTLERYVPPAANAPDGQAAPQGAEGLMQSLALEIARISDQGTGRKRVAPELQKKRDEARAKMEELLEQFRNEGTELRYELKGTVYLDEQQIAATYIDDFRRVKPVEIGWPGVPNEVMRPLNEPARQIFDLFIESIGGSTAAVPRAVRNRLDVLHEKGDPHRQAPETGATRLRDDQGRVVRGQGLSILTGSRHGDMVEIPVLGTLAPPARQLA